MAMEQSLFGPSAASVQDQLLQQDAAFGNNLTPTGLATAIGGSAGRHLGNLMGMEDPRVAEAKAVQEAVQELRSSGVDMNDPAEYFKKMAGIFGAKGLTKQAEMAAAKALEYEGKKEDRAFKKELHGMDVDQKKIQLEKAYADLARAKLKAAGKVDGAEFLEILDKLYKDASVETKTEAIKHFNETGNKEEALALLKAKDKAKWGPVYERQLDGETQLLQDDEISGKTANIGSARARIVNSPTFKVGGELRESEMDKEMGKLGAKNIGELAEQNRTIQKELADLENLQPLLTNMRTGPGADVGNLIDSFSAQFGGGSAQLREAVANRTKFNAVIGQMLLGRIKKLGSNPSDADRNFIKSVLPAANTIGEALAATINYYRKVASEELKDNEGEIAFITKNSGVAERGTGATFRRNRTAAPTTAAGPVTKETVGSMTDDEIKAEIARREKAKK